MYCVNCGVRLADTENSCPLCGTVCYHPELPRQKAVPLYPNHRNPDLRVSSKAIHGVVLTMFLLPIFITLLCDLQLNREITWSGYVAGALALIYVIFVLPAWFHRPNPVIFVPCGFAAAGLYLLYINFAVGGHWFLSLAFPVTGGICLIVTTVVVLMRYVPQGALYIFGGAFIALGVFMPVVEFLIHLTFTISHQVYWSPFPLVALVLLGGLLIFLAINRNARETMERKLFI